MYKKFFEKSDFSESFRLTRESTQTIEYNIRSVILIQHAIFSVP